MSADPTAITTATVSPAPPSTVAHTSPISELEQFAQKVGGDIESTVHTVVTDTESVLTTLGSHLRGALTTEGAALLPVAETLIEADLSALLGTPIPAGVTTLGQLVPTLGPELVKAAKPILAAWLASKVAVIQAATAKAK